MIHDGFNQFIMWNLFRWSLNSLEIRNSSWSKFRIFSHVGTFQSCAVFHWRLVLRASLSNPKIARMWYLMARFGSHSLRSSFFSCHCFTSLMQFWVGFGQCSFVRSCVQHPHFLEPQNYLFICRATKNLRKSMPEDGLCGNCGEYLGRCYWRNPQFFWGKFLMVRGRLVRHWRMCCFWSFNDSSRFFSPKFTSSSGNTHQKIRSDETRGTPRTPPESMEIFFDKFWESLHPWELFDSMSSL